MRRVGIFCGSFNPPLDCHISAAETLLHRFALDEIILAPLMSAGDKNSDAVGYADRLGMCIASVLGKGSLKAVSRPGPLPQILKWFRKSIPDARLFCILDVSLFKPFIDKLSEKNALKDIGFICLYQSDTDAAALLRYALSHDIDLDLLPFPSLRVSESAARDSIFSLNDPADMSPGALKICALQGLYVEDHIQEVRAALNEHRWRHTLGVRQTAVSLAEKYGGPMIKCAVAAFYHDCAKEMSLKDMRRIMTAHGEDGDEEVLGSSAMMHGPVGAYVAGEKYHVRDREVLDAIRFHTTGREEMTLTDLIIFVADAIEPNRDDYPGLSEIRFLAGIDLRAATLYSLYATRDYVLSRGKIFHTSGQKTLAALEEQFKKQPCADGRAAEMLRKKAEAV